jgi:AcrR family transcriptional regulator
MPRKPPRRTRERILETALALFNRDGEPHVTTADIADELNISPGNLYYHFRNKDRSSACSSASSTHRYAAARRTVVARRDVEDLWLFMHLLFERVWEYRFFFRDLDEITSRDRKLAVRVAELLKREQHAVIELCGGLRSADTLRADDAEIVALAVNVVMIATYWMSFQRLSHAAGSADDDPSGMQFERAISQVLGLLAPYLHGEHRALVEHLGARYGWRIAEVERGKGAIGRKNGRGSRMRTLRTRMRVLR